eukprot:TRINITY_DN301_c0_g1_i2.p1 TRINITY_DN301_c0_g1~~TRINITY_DN301_c0_g1_i2.p1  ORF type:complete len:388 (+),score=93.77 TRINITY_DN301_c0_g1_i2:1766-2929(+)
MCRPSHRMSLDVHVVGPSGVGCVVSMGYTDTVNDMKAKVGRKLGFEDERFAVEVEGETVEGDRRAADVLCDGCVVSVSLDKTWVMKSRLSELGLPHITSLLHAIQDFPTATDAMEDALRLHLELTPNDPLLVDLLITSCLKGFTTLCKMLLEHGVDPCATDSEGWTPMHAACQCGEVDLLRMLHELGGNIEAVDLTGMTTVMQAAEAGRYSCVKELVGLRCDLDTRDVEGETVLHKSVQADDASLCRLLVSGGARVSVLNDEGLSPVHFACSLSRVNCLQALLPRADPDQPSQPSGYTPLHFAAVTNCTHTIAILLKWGADPNSRTFDTLETPLHTAAASNSEDACVALIQAGASLSANTHNLTPLDVALCTDPALYDVMSDTVRDL